MPPIRVRRGRIAFTLIELLIVVAIIAILAAIAVPNFLEAQTRAKVSRAKSDMRSLAVAVESYRVDNNRYATPSNDMGVQVVGIDWFETRLSTHVTTPVAYISTPPEDPFHRAENYEKSSQYHYMTRDYEVWATGNTQPWEEYIGELTDRVPGGSVHFALLSHGPDRDHESPNDVGEEPVLYDPTNGTVSRGDIVFAGPGSLLN